ncbi:MAG: hypothetical protein HY791_28370 [Deltaproteobacteria bacterium]|nr:hypothetical protein [Deltaproteobacteria bacterium]
MLRVSRLAILSAGSLLLSCTPSPPPPPVAPTPEAPPGERRIAVVVIVPPAFEKSDDPRTDLGALVTALFETGLADVTAVVPIVEGAPAAGTFRSPRAQPDLRLEPRLELDKETIELRVSSCVPAGPCSVLTASAPRKEIWRATSAILPSVAKALDLPVTKFNQDAWSKPLSKDDYAVTMTGRSAAVVYGLKDPPDESARGDRKKDPVARALFIDPKNALAHWLAGRRYLAEGDPRAARISFQIACAAESGRTAFCAAEAMMLTEIRSGEIAWSVWSKIPGKELRFALPRARAAYMADKYDDALAILDALPEPLKSESESLELRVRIADAQGATDQYDELLARWQSAAPDEPEPVRRRLRLRLAEGKLEEALAFTTELSLRKAEAEAKRFELALAIAMKDYARAEAAAMALASPDVAARIRARAALEADPDSVPIEIATAEDVDAVIVRAEVALNTNQIENAVELAKSLLREQPWLPEALHVLARAEAKRGDLIAARKAFDRLVLAEPELARTLAESLVLPEVPDAGFIEAPDAAANDAEVDAG